MTVKEYAEDVSKTVGEILELCKSLSIPVDDEESLLTDDAIIILDNQIQDEEDYVTGDAETLAKIEMDEKAEALADMVVQEEKNFTKVKKKNKEKKEEAPNFKEERKKLYKHREKLQSNEKDVDDTVIVYKDGMTVKSLADALAVPSSELIKKLMGLGVMATLNNPLSFENAEILVVDYDKTLKKEETQDISNFENYEIEEDESNLVKLKEMLGEKLILHKRKF